jgi:hypothetical protein
LLPEEIIGTEDVPEYISSDPPSKQRTPRLNSGPAINCAAAFGTWSTASGTSLLVARPNASVAWL